MSVTSFDDNEKEIMSVTFFDDNEKEIKKTEKDFFSSEKEALENPFEFISSGKYISALVQCDEEIKLNMKFDYAKNSTGEKQRLVEVKTYGEEFFESIYFPKISESENDLYIIQANYNGMNKYLAIKMK